MALHFVADHKDKLSINNRKYQAVIDVEKLKILLGF